MTSAATARLPASERFALGAELETQAGLSRRLRYFDEGDSGRLQSSIASVGRLLHGLWRALEAKAQ